MADKEQLNTMVDALINDNPEAARVAFHEYLGAKMREELHGVSDETPEPTDTE